MRPPCIPLDDSPSIFEVEETIKIMPNRNAVGPDERLAELLKLILDEDGYGNRHVLELFHDIVIVIWRGGSVSQEREDATIIVFHKKDRKGCGSYCGISLMAQAVKVVLEENANRLSKYCKWEDLRQEEQ